jgi:hypothetical protein
MSLEPGFRVAAESDADVLLEFMRAYYAFDGHGFDHGKARLALTALLRDAQFGRAWLVLDGASPVGYVALCFGYSLEWLGRTLSSTNSTCGSSIAGADGDGKRWPLWRTRRGRRAFAHFIWKSCDRMRRRWSYIA